MSLRSRVAGRLGSFASFRAQQQAVTDQLGHHDHALRDITAALQAVQADTVSVRDHSDEIRKLQLRLDLLEGHLPEILSLTSTARGTQRRFQRQLDETDLRAENHAASIHELWQRLEFVRREVLYEVRYSTPDRPAAEVEPRIVDHVAVDAALAAGSLRLNVGCGHLPMDGYVNVDGRELPGVDVVADVLGLPFDEAVVDEIFSAHLLEHFPEEQLARDLLPYWRSRLRPGGTIRAVVPDAEAMLAGHADGSIPFEDLRAVLYGGQEYEGDFHFTMFTAESLGRLLSEAGFVDVVIEDSGRRNDISLELQVAARRDD